VYEQDQTSKQGEGAKPEAAAGKKDKGALDPELERSLLEAAKGAPGAAKAIFDKVPADQRDAALRLLHETHGSAFVTEMLATPEAVKEEVPGDAALYARAGGQLAPTEVRGREKGQADKGLIYTGKGSMAKNPLFEADAMAFEDRLGPLAWKHPAAAKGAGELAAKCKKYLAAAAGTWEAANERLQKLCATVGMDNLGYSGAVGKAVQDVMAVFEGGNIAERMNHVGEFFIKVLAKDLITKDEQEVEALIRSAEMNLPALQARRDDMLENKTGEWGIAPKTEAIAGQWHARTKNPNPVNGAVSDRTIEQTGIEMSDREVALHQAKQPGWNKETDPVKWEEGTRLFIMNERDKWVQRGRELSLPLGAGPSGTTNMIMHATKMLGANEHDARMACIAYMLPAHHHTLVEILEAAEPHGCSFTKGQRMYRDLHPMSENELKACGKDGKFPDESAPEAAGLEELDKKEEPAAAKRGATA
jgi:hypothetical protein